MRNRALFLDRDGVINVEKNYVHAIEDFQFIAGIFELCRAAQASGFKLFVITNQAGIGRGYYTEDDFRRLTQWMVQEFEKEGVSIDRVYYCPYHPEYGRGTYKNDSFDRKPNPGMLLKAKEDYDIDLSRSILVGDKESDILAGISAGVGYNILVHPAEILSGTKANWVASSLADIKMRLLNYPIGFDF